jgi:glycyl-tRNA synthetase beta chain
MTGLLRDMTFPKQMRWDAYLEDGKGDFPFGRPIRWLVLLYGGRVVPFVIRRTELAQGPTVQDIRSGPNTYGHRFLTTSGRAGRAIKVKTFDDYQARLLENFVILARSEREQRIRRELETHARKLARGSAVSWRRSRRCCRKCRTSSSTPQSSRVTSRSSSSSFPRK